MRKGSRPLPIIPEVKEAPSSELPSRALLSYQTPQPQFTQESLDKPDHILNLPDRPGNLHFIRSNRSIAAEEKAEEIVKELMGFVHSFWLLDPKYLWESFVRIVTETFTIAPTVAGPMVVIVGTFYFLNMLGDPLLQASYGIYNSYMVIFFYAVINAVADKLSIMLSVAFGKGSYHSCKKVFTQGLLLYYGVWLFIVLPLMLFAKTILMAMGVPEANADLTQRILYPTLLAQCIQMLSDTLRNFCMSQGKEAMFGKISLINNILGFLCVYVCVIHLNCRLYSPVIGKLLSEGINLGTGLYVYFYQVEEKTRGLVSLSEALDGFFPFALESLKFMLGSYSEYICNETTTFYVANYHDNNVMGAYSSISSLQGCYYMLGMTFAVILRTRMNVLIGMGRYAIARNYFLFFLASTVVFGIACCIVMLMLGGVLTRGMGSSTPEMSVYALAIPNSCTAMSTFIGIKTVGKISYLLKLNVVMVFLNIILSYPIFTTKSGPHFLLAVLYSLITLLDILCAREAYLNSTWDDSLRNNGDQGIDGRIDEKGELEMELVESGQSK